MARVWYNHGYSQTRDAFLLIRKAAGNTHFLIASHSDDMAPVSLEADLFEVEPRLPRSTPEEKAVYVDWCLDFCRRHRVDVFIAQRGRSAVAARLADFTAIGVKAIVAADAETLDSIEDKARFYGICAEAGLATPMVFEVGNLAEFDDACARIRDTGLNVCIKPPFGVFGNGYWRLRDDMPLFRQLMHPDNREIHTDIVRQAFVPDEVPPRLLVMQHLPGPEWSVDCLCRDSQLVAGVARRKTGSRQVLETEGPAIDLAAAVARTFNLSNLVNIQVKSASVDEVLPHVLEINPRMSGGCLYAEQAGLNLPHLQLLQALGELTDDKLPVCRPTTICPVQTVIELKPAPAEPIREVSHA